MLSFCDTFIYCLLVHEFSCQLYIISFTLSLGLLQKFISNYASFFQISVSWCHFLMFSFYVTNYFKCLYLIVTLIVLLNLVPAVYICWFLYLIDFIHFCLFENWVYFQQGFIYGNRESLFMSYSQGCCWHMPILILNFLALGFPYLKCSITYW